MPRRRPHTQLRTTRTVLSLWERIGGRPEPWKAEGLCAQTDPDAFFPEPSDKASLRLAKRICQACPVRPECLADAMARNERHGIWGGTSAQQRQRLRQQHQQQEAETAPSGTGTQERAA